LSKPREKKKHQGEHDVTGQEMPLQQIRRKREGIRATGKGGETLAATSHLSTGRAGREILPKELLEFEEGPSPGGVCCGKSVAERSSPSRRE